MPTFTSYILQNLTAGLLALLGLAVPVAIHLWNRRPGPTVPVGSVRWLAAAANRRFRHLRLEQLWLLLLRATVVALLALAVAEPRWLRSQPTPLARGLVLLAPETLRPDVLPALRPIIDSLRRRGYALRLFGPRFRPVSPQVWTNTDSLARLLAASETTVAVAGARVIAPPVAAPDDYWARARQAADSFPNQPLRIVAGVASRHFRGPRPALPVRLRWQPVPPPDSVVWLAGAATAGPDTLRLLLGRSGEEATTFRVIWRARPHTAAPLTVPGLPELRYQPGPVGRAASLHQPGQPVVVVAKPLRVLVYADGPHAESARYLRAALQAAALGLAQRLEIRAGSPGKTFAGAAPPDWLFWLSNQPVPPGWRAQVRRGARLWQEAAGGGTQVATDLDLTGLVAASSVAISRLDTTRQPMTKTVAAAAGVWQDGTGRPVLTYQPQGAGGYYHLQTRLQPAWCGLPDSPALPELLLALLRSAQTSPDPNARHDVRQLDARQLAKSFSPASVGDSLPNSKPSPAKTTLPASTRPTTQTTDLRPWVVLAALVLFGWERWLARRWASVSSSIFSV